MAAANENTTNALIVYILYCVGFVVPVTALAGIILAYVSRKEASAFLQSHYDYQIQTFWIGLVVLVVGSILAFVIIGYLVLLGWFVWTLYRVIRGLILLNDKKPIPD